MRSLNQGSRVDAEGNGKLEVLCEGSQAPSLTGLKVVGLKFETSNGKYTSDSAREENKQKEENMDAAKPNVVHVHILLWTTRSQKSLVALSHIRLQYCISVFIYKHVHT